MNNYIILNKKKNKKKVLSIIKELKLKKTFKNHRTILWENDDIQISIDNTIIRIIIFSIHDVKYYNNLFK